MLTAIDASEGPAGAMTPAPRIAPAGVEATRGRSGQSE